MRKTVEFKVDLSNFTNAPDEEENLPSNAQFYFLNELDQLLTAGKTVALQHVEFIDALQALRKYALSGRYGGKLCGFEFEPIGKRSVKIKHIATDKNITVAEQWVIDPAAKAEDTHSEETPTQPTLKFEVTPQPTQPLELLLLRITQRLVQALGDGERRVTLYIPEQQYFSKMLQLVSKTERTTIGGFSYENVHRNGCHVVVISHIETGFVLQPTIDGTSWSFANTRLESTDVEVNSEPFAEFSKALASPLAPTEKDAEVLDALNLIVSTDDVDAFTKARTKISTTLTTYADWIRAMCIREIHVNTFRFTMDSQGNVVVSHTPTGKVSYRSNISDQWVRFTAVES
jgi:hypothetical protein